MSIMAQQCPNCVSKDFAIHEARAERDAALARSAQLEVALRGLAEEATGATIGGGYSCQRCNRWAATRAAIAHKEGCKAGAALALLGEGL